MALETYEDLLMHKRASIGGGKRATEAHKMRTRPQRDFIQRQMDKGKYQQKGRRM